MSADRVITPLNQSSDKWGNCEVCGKYVANVHRMNLRPEEIKNQMRVVRGHRACIQQFVTEKLARE